MIKFEEIKKANETIITTDIKGKEYAEVNQRIKAFRMCYPEGVIETTIISLENGKVLMQAVIKNGEGKVIGTGYAQEKEGSTFINKTSFIENCETSAVGRALGMCGFGIDTSVASYEEVMNAMENQKEQPKTQNKAQNKPNTSVSNPTPTNTLPYKEKLVNLVKANGWNINEVAAEFKLNAKSTDADFKLAYEELGGE